MFHITGAPFFIFRFEATNKMHSERSKIDKNTRSVQQNALRYLPQLRVTNEMNSRNRLEIM